MPSSQPLETKGTGGENQQTTPPLGNILLQPEQPSWSQSKLCYKTILEKTVLDWLSKRLSDSRLVLAPLPYSSESEKCDPNFIGT